MIETFADKATEDIFHGRSTSKTRKLPPELLDAAAVKLDMLNACVSVQDLRSPPGNRLEALRGDLKGRYSIRINDQWRLVFGFANGRAHDVQITDYH